MGMSAAQENVSLLIYLESLRSRFCCQFLTQIKSFSNKYCGNNSKELFRGICFVHGTAYIGIKVQNMFKCIWLSETENLPYIYLKSNVNPRKPGENSRYTNKLKCVNSYLSIRYFFLRKKNYAKKINFKITNVREGWKERKRRKNWIHSFEMRSSSFEFNRILSQQK